MPAALEIIPDAERFTFDVGFIGANDPGRLK